MPDTDVLQETSTALEIAITDYITARADGGYVGDFAVIAEHVAHNGDRNIVVHVSPTMTPWKLGGMADYGHALLHALVQKMFIGTMRRIYGDGS